MVYEIEDKVFLVTGAASGIGAGVVNLLLDEGAKHIAILDIAEAKGIEIQTNLNSKYGSGKVKYYNCDITKDEQLFGAYKSIIDEQGYIDVVINNAGLMNDSLATYKKEIELNLTALVTSTYKAIEVMRKDEGGKGGTIINVASAVALHSTPVFPVYFATKSAVLQFGRCVGKDDYYVNTGVRIFTICYGATETPLFDNMNNFDKHMQKRIPEFINAYPHQKMETAAKATVEAYKRADNGSIWLSTSEKPVQDITENVNQAYDLLYGLVYH